MADGNYLLEQIAELDAWRRRTHPSNATEPGNTTLDPWQKADAAELVLAVAAYVRENVNLGDLERRSRQETSIDIESLKTVTKILRDAKYEFTFASGKPFAPDKWLENLDTLIKGLATPEKLSEFEVLLRLSFVGDGPIDSLLMGAAEVDALEPQLEPMLLKKLELLTDDDALDLLQQYLRESDPARAEPIPLSPEIRAELVDVKDAADARKKIARYLLRARPRAIRTVLSQNESAALPMLSVGIARILSWEGGAEASTPSSAEVSITKNLGRLSFVWTKLLHRDVAALAKPLGLQPDAALLVGREFITAQGGNTDPVAADWIAMVHVLTDLVRAVSAHVREAPRSVAALLAYKLGLEVMLPAIHAETKEKKELQLQKELCRFLVERDVRAYGKSFGPGEIDLIAEDAYTTLVIETKLLKDNVTESVLRKWLAQLQQYMDREPRNHYGALVIYNFTKVPLITPRPGVLLVKRRVYVLPINVIEARPSERKDAIEIIESADPNALIAMRGISRPPAIKAKVEEAT